MTTIAIIRRTYGVPAKRGDHKSKEPKKCCGECDEHTSDPRQVRVRHRQSGTDWGLFWYCDAAIAEDRRRGLTVEDA